MEWRKQPGEAVRRGENLVDLETDKVTLEVTAPDDGVLKEVRKQTGEAAVSNEVLAIIDTAATATVEMTPPAELPQETVEPAFRLSPAVRKLVAEHALNPAEIPASGKEGRVTKADVIDYLTKTPTSAVASAPASGPSTAAQPTATVVAQAGLRPAVAGERAEQRIPMTRLRKRAAERLLAAQHENAILTTFNEVNMQRVMSLRERYRESFEKA